MTADPPTPISSAEGGFKVPSPSEPQYGGFWVRLGALLLDGIIASPLTLLLAWSASRNRPFYLGCYASYYVFTFWSMILLVRWRGGSPGKLLWGLRVLRTDLSPVGWREAWLREGVTLAVNLLQSAAYVFAVSQLSDHDYL